MLGGGRMTSRIFSINLDDVTFAKLGELQKKYPDKSRNGMIRHIIHVVHSGDGLDNINWKARCEALQIQIDKLKGKKKILSKKLMEEYE